MRKYALILCLTTGVLFSSCGGGDDASTDAAKLEKLKKEQADLSAQIAELEAKADTGKVEKVGLAVKVEELKLDTFTHYIELQGKVQSDQNVMVTAKAPAVITSVNVSEGDRVTAGQVLASLDAAVLQQSLAEVQTGLDLAKTVFEKQERLWNQKIGTEIQYLQAKANYESMRRRMATTQSQLALYTIRAPFSGVIDQVNARLGEAAAPGAPLFRLVGEKSSKLVAEVPESYLTKVKTGTLARVNFPELNEEYKSKVTTVGRVISNNSRSFSIELAVPKTQSMLRPNMIANIRLNDYSVPKTASVPVNTVQQDEKGKYVMVAEKGAKGYVARKKYVETGLSYGGRTEVKSGLSAGDMVITAGYLDVNESQSISI